MAEKLTPKPPQAAPLEPSDVKEVSSGSGVSFAAVKTVIDTVLGRGAEEHSRHENAGETPAGVV